MSGICALVHRDGQPVELTQLKQMTDFLSYLGPDRQEIWCEGHVGLGHALFGTTYESQNEQQPCTLDGKVYVTADARIDARDDLIAQLKAQGCSLAQDAPDAILILAAYQVWGEGCLTRMLGDFSLILWDEPQQKLLCAGDRFGMKNLYYRQIGETLALSNCLACLREVPGANKRLNEQAIADFLLFGDYTWLDKSITTFAEIQRVPPAHALIWQGQQVRVERYWDFPLDTPLLRYQHEEDYLEHFRELLTTAVRDRLRTDRVVISMSGGMDSSSVAAIACQIRKQELPNLKIQAFTAVYDRIHPDRERYYAGLVAQKLGLPIHYFVCDGYPLLLPPTATVEPLEDYTPAMRLEMVRQASSLGRVLLTGNSADNLLMCSSIGSLFPEMNPFSIAFQVIRLWKLFGKRPPLGLGLMAKLKGKDSPSYDYPSWLNPDFETKLNLKERWQYGWKHQPAPLHRRHPQVHLSLVSPDWRSETECFSPNDFTPYEERDPFLDWRLVEFILSLPTLPWLFQKYVLRQGMRRSLPLEVITRPKTPLGSVHDSLLEQPEATWVDWWQPDPRLLSYANPKKIPSMGRGSLEARDSYIHLRPLLLNIWLQQH